MNQVVTQQPQAERRASPVELYAAQVMGDDVRSGELFRALPRHIPAARFQRNLLNLIMQKPEMMKYDARFVFREVSKAAALGLLLDPQLGEAYIVPVWNGGARREEPQLRVGYRGIMKLARQSGNVANIYPGEVCELDHFLVEEGTERRLEHQPDYTRPRGNPVCYYAVVIYKDGTKDFEVMDIEALHRIRDRSDAWRAFQAGKIKSTPWATDEGEMCKKTVLRRLGKRMPQCPDLAEALGYESELDQRQTHVIDVPQVSRPQPKSIESRLDAFANDEHPDPAEADIHPTADAGKEAPAAAQPEASEESAPTTSASADSSLPDNIRDAMEKGRSARRSGHSREVPRNLQYKSRQAEADAFLQGWDEENYEAQAAEGGVV